MCRELKVGIVVDYQNMHLTAAGIFASDLPQYQSLIDPVRLAKVIIDKKNATGHGTFKLEKLEVYRGLPSPFIDPVGNARNLKQYEEGKKEATLNGITASFTSRPLKYESMYRANKFVPNPHKPQEKGVDVLCAIALVRMAQSGLYDVVVLASRDTDLGPALEEANKSDSKIEAVKWFDRDEPTSFGMIRVNFNMWTTQLGRQEFEQSRDPRDYEDVGK